MSYIRYNHPLEYFEGYSNLYVFPSLGDFVEDYNTNYNHNASLAELLVKLILRATGDEKYAWKMAGILAKKLKVKRRKHKLTTDEYIKLSNKMMKKLGIKKWMKKLAK